MLPNHCSPIKAPEQVEEEKAIDGIEDTILANSLIDGNCVKLLAKELHEAGYHNQPKVSELNVSEWLRFAGFPRGGDVARINIEALVTAGYIIETKESES